MNVTYELLRDIDPSNATGLLLRSSTLGPSPEIGEFLLMLSKMDTSTAYNSAAWLVAHSLERNVRSRYLLERVEASYEVLEKPTSVSTILRALVDIRHWVSGARTTLVGPRVVSEYVEKVRGSRGCGSRFGQTDHHLEEAIHHMLQSMIPKKRRGVCMRSAYNCIRYSEYVHYWGEEDREAAPAVRTAIRKKNIDDAIALLREA